jgi:hypothetical protein
MAMKPRNPRVTAASVVLAAGFGLLAAACGSTAAPPTDGGLVATNPASKAKLQVIESMPGGQARHWSLRCNPAGGTMPDAAAACRLLATDATILHPRRATHIMCPMIVANARTFTITGTWHGTKLHEVVTDGGCDLRRWSMMAQIFN